MPSKTVHILDSHAMIHRAWHVASKNDVSAVYIFAQMLLFLIRERSPSYLVAAEDREDSRVARQVIYPDYKKKKEERDLEELKVFWQQEALMKRLLDEMGIPRINYSGYEADDVIATLAKGLSQTGQKVVIVGVDKDFYQLLSSNVVMYNPVKRIVIDSTVLEEKNGFCPKESATIQALTGDASDNVPGIPGVGIKTAIKLVRMGKTVEGIFKNLSLLSPKLKQLLQEYKGQVFMARELVTLHCDLPLEDIELRPFTINDAWRESVKAFFEEQDFSRNMSARLYLLRTTPI